MTTQIFMGEDNKALIYDNNQLDEFKALVSELGLQCNNHLDNEKSPIPFMWLDEATIRAFKLLCPQVDRLSDYKFEIPLEILQNAKLCTVENYFDWMEVWSNRKDPDPFLIGRVYKQSEHREKSYTWAADHYLIGRWGAEKKEVPELIEMALHIATERIKIYTQSTIAKLRSWQECPELWAKQYLFNNNTEAQHAIGDNNSLPF